MKRPGRSRGLGVIELLFALALVCVAIFTLLSVFSKSSRHAVMSRNRTVAIMLAHTLLDEVKAHPYGVKKPKRWAEPTETPVTVYVEGRPQQMAFMKKMSFQDGGFVGEGSGDTDEVTIKIEWNEGVGSNHGHKEMSVRVPVWR